MNWLNQNHGVVMTALTFVYVIATLVIVFLTRQSVKTAVTLEKNRLRPYVIFNVSSSTASHLTFASVRNLGLTAAYNVKVTVEPALERVELGLSSLTTHPILFLPPGEEITDVLGFSPAFHEKYPKPEFQGSVSYQNHGGESFTEPFRIDLTFLAKRIFVRESIVDELKHIGETLKSITQQLEGDWPRRSGEAE